MVRRKVTGSEKGRRREITGLYGPSFGYRSAKDVIEDIEQHGHQYFVREGSYEADVLVVRDGTKQRLESTRDVLSMNNLQNLPSC